jgi:hypothetical protein
LTALKKNGPIGRIEVESESWGGARMKATFWIGMIGFILSMLVLTVSLLLPIVNRGRASWSEAALGIVPGAVCSFAFLVTMLIGMFLMLNARQQRTRRSRRHPRGFREQDYGDDEPGQERRRNC